MDGIDGIEGDFNYCPRCGNGLSQSWIEGKTRRRCDACGFVAFFDPKLAVAVLISTGDGLVMVRRGVEPQLGMWAFPSGYVDRGEVVEQAAAREAMEETGLHVSLDALIGVYSMVGNPVALIVYSAHIVGGTLAAGHDATDARFFPMDELPDLPFPHDARILADWKAMMAAGRIG